MRREGLVSTACACAKFSVYFAVKLSINVQAHVNFSYSGVREKQIRILADILAMKDGELQVKWLWLIGNKLTDKTVSYLFNKASAAFQSLIDLNLSG